MSGMQCDACGSSDFSSRGNCRPCTRRRAHSKYEMKKRVRTREDRWPCRQCAEPIGWHTRGGNKKTICNTCAPTDRWRTLVQRYGVDKSMYEAMYFEQDGKCAIPVCPREAKAVDHCHATGAVRGLLCQGCNVALGFVEASMWLDGAHEYLRR